MSTTAISAAAQAADLPRKAPPLPVVASPWDGLYAGVQGGYSWANSSGTLSEIVGGNAIPWTLHPQGFIVGGHAGYGRQIGSVVVGVEADLEWAGHNSKTTLPDRRFAPFGFPTTDFVSDLNWLASVRGRVGIPFGNTLVYGTGGFAAADVVTKYFPGGFPLSFANLSKVRPGWTVGAGVEHAFAPGWSGRAEYRYTELDSPSFYEVPFFSFNATDRNHFNFHALRVGVSYRPDSLPGARPQPSVSSLFAVLPASRWTGFYGGAHLGGARNQTTGETFGLPEPGFAFTPHAISGLDSTGLLGGVQLGYNHQFGQFVLGVEHDVSFTDLKSSAGGATVAVTAGAGNQPVNFTHTSKLETLASLRGRVGFAPNDKWLVYGTGGIAYGRVNATTTAALPGVATTFFGSRDDTLVGWIAGVGAQYALSDRWSVRGEYLHYDLGEMNVVGLPAPPDPTVQTQATFGWRGDILRVGVDYRFGVPQALTATPAFPTKAPVKAPKLFSDYDFTFGGRYWYSTGKSRKDLFGLSDVNGAMVSRITYDKLETHAAETFFRLDHRGGLFVKGFAGIGKMTSGNQNDEDFPPAIVPYSNTASVIHDSKINYLSADVGYDFLRTPTYRLGAFAGYHYDHEKMNEYGCRQVAAAPFCVGPAFATNSFVTITDDNHWHSLRVGLSGSVQVAPRLTLSGEAAWLPYTRLDASDTHWLRQTSIANGAVFSGLNGALPEDGVGHKGYQVEAMLNYQLTDAFSIGAGGRYWHMETRGTMHFENVTVRVGNGGAPQPLNYYFDRYGGFVQGSYKF